VSSPLSKVLARSRQYQGNNNFQRPGGGGGGGLVTPPEHDAADAGAFQALPFGGGGGSLSSSDGLTPPQHHQRLRATAGRFFGDSLDEPLPPPGFGPKLDFDRSESPESDAGYGTSYDSVASRQGNGSGYNPGRDINDLLASCGLTSKGEDPLARRPPRPLQRSAGHQGSSPRHPPPPPFRDQARFNSRLSSFPELDPSMAQAVRSLQALQQQQQMNNGPFNNGCFNPNGYLSGSPSPPPASAFPDLYNGNFEPTTPPPHTYNGGEHTSLERAARIHRNGTGKHQ